MVYRMIFNQTAYFGRGAIKEIPTEAKARGFTKAFIVTDSVLVENGTVKKVTDVLDEAQIPYEIFDDVQPNPPVENIQHGVEEFKKSGADFLIGLGGGSPQDTCKGIGIVVTNPEFSDVLSLEGVAATKNPSVPIFGVPTTAGTASETTINYVITDTKNKRKFVAVDPHDIPVVAFVDPDLTDGMPRGLKVATGLDALTHAIESVITPGAWNLSDALSMQTIRMIAQNLAKSVEGDKDAGEQMAYAPTSPACRIRMWAWALCTAWRIRSVAASVWRMAWPTASCLRRSWSTTRTIRARSTATSPMRSVSRTPTPETWSMCATRPCRPSPSSPGIWATRRRSAKWAPPKRTLSRLPRTRSPTCARRAIPARPRRRISWRSTAA